MDAREYLDNKRCPYCGKDHMPRRRRIAKFMVLCVSVPMTITLLYKYFKYGRVFEEPLENRKAFMVLTIQVPFFLIWILSDYVLLKLGKDTSMGGFYCALIITMLTAGLWDRFFVGMFF